MDPTAVRRWQPASHDVNVRAPYYFIGVASRECWDCDTGSRVHGFILPPGLQTFYVGDEPEDDRWESSEEPSLVCYLAYLQPCVAVRIKARTRHYRIGYRDTTKSFYWMNFCEQCGAKLGDFETFCEPRRSSERPLAKTKRRSWRRRGMRFRQISSESQCPPKLPRLAPSTPIENPDPRRLSRLYWMSLVGVGTGPCRDRTYDQEIKSLLLYQLS